MYRGVVHQREEGMIQPRGMAKEKEDDVMEDRYNRDLPVLSELV